ncbi:MAG: putative signal transducing protein [Sphingobacterium thalpophilum]
MEAGWVKIYTSADFLKSEIVKQVLIDHEIDTIIINKQGFPYRIGEVEVYIHENDFQKALEIIVKNEL